MHIQNTSTFLCCLLQRRRTHATEDTGSLPSCGRTCSKSLGQTRRMVVIGPSSSSTIVIRSILCHSPSCRCCFAASSTKYKPGIISCSLKNTNGNGYSLMKTVGLMDDWFSISRNMAVQGWICDTDNHAPYEEHDTSERAVCEMISRYFDLLRGTNTCSRYAHGRQTC